jgi:hypothetical protein
VSGFLLTVQTLVVHEDGIQSYRAFAGSSGGVVVRAEMVSGVGR